MSANNASEWTTAVEEAARLITDGEVVALPTETVYGLAADASSEQATRRIFEIKNRPPTNPLIVHVDGVEMAQGLVAEWPESARLLAQHFWPGPLTMALPKNQRIPDSVTAHGNTVALRAPGHPLMREVIRVSERPIAAPSANLSGELSPTRAEHVTERLGGRIRLVVDAGPCRFGIESTVIDLSGERPTLLRPGHIHEQAIFEATGIQIVPRPTVAEGPAKSPGLETRHYSPEATLHNWKWDSEDELGRLLDEHEINAPDTYVIAHRVVPIKARKTHYIVFPDDAEAYARALYDQLHQLDRIGARHIVVEALADGPEWNGLRDRLSRASRGKEPAS